MSRGRPAEIAIIGMGCRFAGASDLCSYFENILAARDCTREAPPDRWDPATFCDAASEAVDRVPSCRGGYLDSPIPFDAPAHGIMPRTVLGGEPEQFLLLDATAAALADAGLGLGDLKGNRVEVVIGRGNYFNRGNLTRLQRGRMIAQTLSLLSGLFPEWTAADRQAVAADLSASLPPFEAATIPGQLTNATAGRIAHRLDSSGASFVVDAASASSLVALDLAMTALRLRRADLAIAGGVYLEADVDFPMVFRQLNALSRSGTARPFAAGADGMIPGEGVGAVVLKRRADAERAGDRIYAVVQGVGIASDGRSQGLAAPSPRGHARAIRRAYRRSGIDPSTVMLVEGHGLGVPAADRAELRSYSAIFPPLRHGRRHLGAVSSMIGHAMPAAGMAGLIKTALALFHRVLPPTLHAEEPHPLLDRPESPFALVPSARPWIHSDPDAPRRAAVSAFGFAGINAHAVLEEHAPSADSRRPGALRHWETEAILLSAPDRAGLAERVRQLIDRLKRNPRPSLLDVAYTLNCVERHPQGGSRLGVVASSLPELAERLTDSLGRLSDPACRAIRDGRGVYYWDEPVYALGRGGLAFLFPGEGSQYPGMLADLCIHFPEVRRLFDTADRIARELGETLPPSEHLFGPVCQADLELWSAATAVNLVLNAQWALFQVLQGLGLVPDAVVGHSSGELLALAAAGVFPTDRALEQRLGRLGAIFRGFETSGELPAARLLAVAADRQRVEALCRNAGASGAAIAMDNCPHQVVVAVPESEVERTLDVLRAEGVLHEDLPFERAYHTAGFGRVTGPIADFFAAMTLQPPRLAIYSCASRQRMPDDTGAIRELAVAQWTRTVAFRETIETMHADGLRLFVDVGARGNLAGFVEDILRGKPAFAFAANIPRRSGLAQLNQLVAATFAQGVPVKTDSLYSRRRPHAIDWDAPEPAPRTMVELSIGFPEMRLSEDLVARLRSTVGVPAPADGSDPGGGLRDREVVPHDPAIPSRSARNGFPHDGRPWPAALALPSVFEQVPFKGEEELSRSMPVAPVANSRTEQLKVTAAPCASEEVDSAMLAFQETMQAFLQAQHAVMTAYLRVSTDDRARSEQRSGVSWQDAATALAPEARRNGSPSVRGDDSALDQFSSLEGQRAITSGPEPGPWAGEIRWLKGGAEIETVLILDRRDDPVAENHTLGGRKVSALDPSLKGLPVVPFAVMAEMTIQAAALVVSPGLVFTGLERVRAHKWIQYEEEPIVLELRGRCQGALDDERVWVGIFNRGPGGNVEASRPVFEATVVFSPSLPAPPRAAAWTLENARPSRFTPDSVYAEQWLFHGPAFRAISHVGSVSQQGIDGTVRVLPCEPLVKDGQPARFHSEVIVIDTFTQLLGCWGLDYLTEGDVVFPLSMAELEVLGGRPIVHSDVACRIAVRQLERHRVRVDAEIVRSDGTVWMRIRNWEDWRFHWPGRYRDVFRQPRDFFVGQDLALVDPDRGAVPQVVAVWLEPPADMGRPVWRDVLVHTQLGPAERAILLATAGPQGRLAQRLWGRMAAKEAARRLWHAGGRPPIYPADLTVLSDAHGRPRLAHVARPAELTLPAISIAHCDGVAVALAAHDPGAHVGIGVEAITDRPESFEASAFTTGERSLLAHWSGPSRDEWAARFWCAKEAAAKATDAGIAAGRSGAEIVDADGASGAMSVRLAPALFASCHEQFANPLRVVSARRGEYAWAWTVRQGASS
jgi:acyl transferase domain-containing protein/phosphopantetheinyl transferase (holo-ACP synthase)